MIAFQEVERQFAVLVLLWLGRGYSLLVRHENKHLSIKAIKFIWLMSVQMEDGSMNFMMRMV